LIAAPLTSLIEVGRVARAHGIRGDVRVALHWEHSDALSHVDEVVLSGKGRTLGTFRIRSVRAVDRGVLLSLVGVEDRDRAESLRGATVSVARAALPPLEDGEYYLCDLVGASVASPNGPVGEVIEVRVYPSVDTLVVRAPDGTLYEQVIAEPWIAKVDVPNGRIELTSADGLVVA
jgi:16S rRNA processing protein RimM